MNERRPHSALFLLTVFVAGGFLAPTLHGLEHAKEWKDARSERVTTNDHHHHVERDNHGDEFVLPCPNRLDANLTCALCRGVSSAPLDDSETSAFDLLVTIAAETAQRSTGDATHGFYLVRGPPKQAT